MYWCAIGVLASMSWSGRARRRRRFVPAADRGVYTERWFPGAGRTQPPGPGPPRGGFMAAATITIRNNGSIRIEGDFVIVDQEGRAFDLAGRTMISLCRCGQSSNKP